MNCPDILCDVTRGPMNFSAWHFVCWLTEKLQPIFDLGHPGVMMLRGGGVGSQHVPSPSPPQKTFGGQANKRKHKRAKPTKITTIRILRRLFFSRSRSVGNGTCEDHNMPKIVAIRFRMLQTLTWVNLDCPTTILGSQAKI